MVILGLSYVFQYNTSAVLLVDGELVAWSEEERHTRVKHAPCEFPHNAAEYVLNKAGLTIGDVDRIATTHVPVEEISKIRNSKAFAEYVGLSNIDWYGDYPKLLMHNEGVWGNTVNNINQHFDENNLKRFPIHLIDRWSHHLCHAVSSVIPSGFQDTNFISNDGDGGEDAGKFGYFDGKFHQLGYMHPLGSIGAYYSDVTHFLGFKYHSSEGKTMGLACYGEVDEQLFPKLHFENGDGFLQPRVNESRQHLWDNYSHLHEKFKEDVWCDEAKNLAATLQSYFEEIMLHNVNRLRELHPSNNLCLAGGSFLNCTSNGKIAKLVDNIYIQPASHDSGTTLGAAILTHHKYTNKWPNIRMNHAYYGSEFTKEEVKQKLDENNLVYSEANVEIDLAHMINQNLVDPKTKESTCDPVIPFYNLSFTIPGIGGIKPFDMFHIDYLPEHHRWKCMFQVNKISHSVSLSGWTTTIESVMRVDGKEVETARKEPFTDIDIISAEEEKGWLNQVNKLEEEEKPPEDGEGKSMWNAFKDAIF